MSDIRVIIVGKIDKEDWEHNFALVDAALDALGEKLPTSQKAAANGLASLNADSKVIQVALNSERLNGKTEAELTTLFILQSVKGAANGVAELDATGKLKAAQVPDSITAGLTYKGIWNANTNSPTIPTAGGGNENWFYIVGVAGTTTIDGINTWGVGDWIISNGTAWERIPATVAPVLTVAGKTGDVLLELADIVDLVSTLAIKKNIGAELVDSANSDFDEFVGAGDFRVADIAAMANRPGGDTGETGEGFLSVEKYSSSLKHVITIINTGNMFSRVFSGSWSAWRALN